jgi:hypothetical protein
MTSDEVRRSKNEMSLIFKNNTRSLGKRVALRGSISKIIIRTRRAFAEVKQRSQRPAIR